MANTVRIGRREIGEGHPVYLVAEMSGNHGHDPEQARRIVRAAAASGADAVKLQTYTADTITMRCDSDLFRVKGTVWAGRTLHDLYSEAYTPWEWHAALRDEAASCGLDFFSTPFDPTAVDFLEELGVAVHKVASFELVDLPLLKKIGATRKPVIMSTGMATPDEIAEGVATLRDAGCPGLVLLKCTSAYPAPAREMNLRTIPDMRERYGMPVGLSDHTMDLAVPVAAVALGACVIEKHLALSRALGGPDAGFSLEPAEFKAMAAAVRTAESALGQVSYRPTDQEAAGRAYRRSLFVTRAVREGERFTTDNVRSIRPANGLPPRDFDRVLRCRAKADIPAGTPLDWALIHTEKEES